MMHEKKQKAIRHYTAHHHRTKLDTRSSTRAQDIEEVNREAHFGRETNNDVLKHEVASRQQSRIRDVKEYSRYAVAAGSNGTWRRVQH